MTALLSLAPPPSELAEIAHLEQAVDAGLTLAIDSLAALRQRDAHVVRGFDLWHQYVLARFGEALARLRLPDGERLALVQSMCTKTGDRPRGLPVREQAKHLGVALDTVQRDREKLGLVTPAGPRARKAATGPAALPSPTGMVYEQAAEWLHRADAGLIPGHDAPGLTLVELAAVAGWTEGKASGALHYLRAPSRELAVRTEETRAAQRVHLLTEVGRTLVALRPTPGASS